MPFRTNWFSAMLTGAQEVPILLSEGSGRFLAVVGHDGGVLRYSLRYENLDGGEVRSAHIHFGLPGTNGGVIAFLCSNDSLPAGVDTPFCPEEGEILESELESFDVIGPEAQGIEPGAVSGALRALRAGAAYVNVHTDGFPGGELRGRIDKRGSKKKRKKSMRQMKMDD